MLTWRYLYAPALMYKAYAMLLSLQNHMLSKSVFLMRQHALDNLLHWWKPYWFNHLSFSPIFSQHLLNCISSHGRPESYHLPCCCHRQCFSFLSSPTPQLIVQNSLLTDACASSKGRMGVCGLGYPRGHVHVSAPYWVGPTAHLWRASWPCLLWCGNKKAGHVPHVTGTGELILPCSQEWRQKHGCRRIGSSFASHHTWRGGGDLAHTRLTNSVIIQVQIQGPE